MFVEFDQLADSSRVWIFQSTQSLNAEKQQRISDHLNQFIAHWQAHGNDLLASFKIQYNRFIIVALDEASYQATGCSIDKLTHLIQDMEKALQLSLLDRMQISYKENDSVEVMSMPKFKSGIGSLFNENTLVFNNLIETKGQLNDHWEVAIKDSWHKQMLA